MSARDRFAVPLDCPNCHNKGTARMSQADGYAYLRDTSTNVEFLPEGFKEVRSKDRQKGGFADDVTIYCATCDVSAEVGPTT